MIVINARITHLGVYDAESSTIRIGLRFYPIVGLNKRGKKSGCIWSAAQLYRVRITMPMLSIAFFHWFATFQTQTSSTVKSDSIFQGLVYSNFLPPLSNPSIV